MSSLDFERIMALSYKACKLLHYTYQPSLVLCEEKALDVWVANKDKINEMNDCSELSKTQVEKKIYFFFKDKIRVELGIYQAPNHEGKVKWHSPYMQEAYSGYDVVNDNEVGLEILDSEFQKKIYYEHQRDFNLNRQETLFIDLIFSGYNPTNHVDILIFKEALGTTSNGYIKNYFNRLCKKLIVQSEKLGFR